MSHFTTNNQKHCLGVGQKNHPNHTELLKINLSLKNGF
jgi:hypothetical protein